MSTAQKVVEVEPQGADWLNVPDTDGRVWRYERRGALHSYTRPHLLAEYDGRGPIRLTLARDDGGNPVLRQDGPGLPARIAVQDVSVVLGREVGFWLGVAEYERVG